MCSQGTSGPQDGLRLVDEHKGKMALASLFPGDAEDLADLALRFPQPHVEDLWSLDVQEITTHFFARFGA